MQFTLTSKFFALALTLLIAPSIASPVAEGTSNSKLVPASHEAMNHWLANTDAELIYVGEPSNPLTSRSTQADTVVYCDRYNPAPGRGCEGACKVYQGGPTCLNAPGTACVFTTREVLYCKQGGCSDCTDVCLSPLIYPPPVGCATPGTNSILVNDD